METIATCFKFATSALVCLRAALKLKFLTLVVINVNDSIYISQLYAKMSFKQDMEEFSSMELEIL